MQRSTALIVGVIKQYKRLSEQEWSKSLQDKHGFWLDKSLSIETVCVCVCVGRAFGNQRKETSKNMLQAVDWSLFHWA